MSLNRTLDSNAIPDWQSEPVRPISAIIASMRLGCLLLLAVGAQACSEPSLQIQLDIPSPYREQVSSVSLAVIVPPHGSPFGCDEIAFGTVGDDIVEANTVDELPPLRGTNAGSLKSLPREDYKILYARGFNTDGEQIVAGCAEFGVIEGQETQTITAEAVTIATLPASGLGDVAAPATPIQITDYAGQPVAGVETRWTVSGPGALPASDSGFSDQDGTVLISIEAPPLPGPVAVDIHAKWARTEPPRIDGFLEPAALLRRDLTGPGDGSAGLVRDPEELYQVGRLGPNGEIGLVGMGAPEAGQRQLTIVYFDLEEQVIREAVTAPLPAAAVTPFLLTKDGREQVHILTTSELLTVSPTGDVTSSVATTSGLVRKTFALGGCEDPEAVESTLLVFLGGETRVYGPDGFINDSPFTDVAGEPLASGCISSGDTLHRAVVYQSGNNLVTVVVDMDDGVRTGSLAVIPSGISFSPATGSEDALLLATTLGLEGTDLVRYAMLPVGASDIAFEPVASNATPTFARSTLAADFDDDGHTDVAGVLTFGDTSSTTEYRLYITLGLPTGAIAGVSPVAQGLRPRIWTRDFNRDGYDDIVVASANSFVIFSMAAP